MRCQLLFARDERPGVLVLDCIAWDEPGTAGVPCAVELQSPGRSLAEELAISSIRRWDAAGLVTDVDLRLRDGRVRVDVRAADGSLASVAPTRVVGVATAPG